MGDHHHISLFQIAEEREKEIRKQQEEAEASAVKTKPKDDENPKVFRPGVGKYINMAAT